MSVKVLRLAFVQKPCIEEFMKGKVGCTHTSLKICLDTYVLKSEPTHKFVFDRGLPNSTVYQMLLIYRSFTFFLTVACAIQVAAASSSACAYIIAHRAQQSRMAVSWHCSGLLQLGILVN